MEVIVLEIDQENRRISLGHKQLEENPWEVFQSTFAEGTVHSGTIIEMKDKSGIVSLPYGLEGICPAKHLKKANGENAKTEDALDFKVIEFNKDSRKIVVSHVRTHEEHVETTSSRPARKSGNNTSNNLNAINKNAEKSTLGDLDALAELKEKMDKNK